MKKITFVAGILAFLMPIILIAYITYLEMEDYKPNIEYRIAAKSYGEPSQISRMNIEETVHVNGKLNSHDFDFVEWDSTRNPKVRISVSLNEEVRIGGTLVYVNNKPLASSVNGVIQEINIIEGYVKILDIDKLVLESYTDTKNANKLELNKWYVVDQDVKIKLISLSNVMTELGRMASYALEGGSFLYQEHVKFEIPTGVVYTDALTVSKESVYQKELDGPYYIRRVESTGQVIGEVEVKVGIANKDMITITGVEEGWFADPGYAQLMRSEMGFENE
ncbi:hypothetical protein HYG86_01190 [Alkalicella caledoniensis]|uniref:Uncharacterized protein n=1 Tax=Alkalicella caledoniensis TaxID=2731377 RepID=A0A7G9W466_ALKCA|nr:hypothetical protein [Alkalicella caledoniensis]QNO13478.1 hypothetical protein HYG86_01190 [Alkalicella caledoniensis]